jgi:hypothetical protein
MAKKGKTQLLITWVATPDKVAEMDRLVESTSRIPARFGYTSNITGWVSTVEGPRISRSLWNADADGS